MKPNQTLESLVLEQVDQRFADEQSFLAELVKIPTDNPPGDCVAHATKAQALLEQLGFTVEAHPVPEEAVRAVGMISATNLIVRRKFGEGGPCVALNAHGDVVPPGLGWTQDPYGAAVIEDPQHGATMFGRGVAVSKSDFATYTFALLALQSLFEEGRAAQGNDRAAFHVRRGSGRGYRPALAARKRLEQAGLRALRRLLVCGHHGAQRRDSPGSDGARQTRSRRHAGIRNRCARCSHSDSAGDLRFSRAAETTALESFRHQPSDDQCRI